MMQKRLFDVVAAMSGLLLLSPLFVIIAIAIKISSRGPIIFLQERVGRYGQRFFIHKFRTMIVNAENYGLKLTVANDCRITKVGNIIRKSKLDELPQLFDVLIGKMAIVGPRPEVPKYVELYPHDIAKKVLSVRPGITDYASIAMINESEILAKYSNIEEAYIKEIMPLKLKFACEYVDNHSFMIDCKIIAKTICKMIKKK